MELWPMLSHTAGKNLSTINQLLPPARFAMHHPKSGLNPLVDAASYLFSLIGKLKNTKTYRHLSKLHKELTEELRLFQEAITLRGYNSEYLLVSRYALCATLDDVITHTAWGHDTSWNDYRLLATFNQDMAHQERFFIILERITKDPAHYMDLMEFMYICLSLGFQGNYRSTELGHYQLEQITYTLYKHIRAHRSHFTKTLSPFPITLLKIAKPIIHKTPLWLIPLITLSLVLLLFASLGYVLDSVSDQAYQELLHIEKVIHD